MGNGETGSKVRTPVKGPRKRLLQTDPLPFQPAQVQVLPPVAPVSVLLLEVPSFLSPSLLFPCPLHWERGVSSRGPPGKSQRPIYDKTWNLPPPWAGLLHLAEERVVLKVSQRLFASQQPFPGRKRNA